MHVLLVRHAHAAPGDPDALRPLTAEGRAAAARLAEQLAAGRLDAVLSSPLVRARETAEAIAHAAALEVEIDERLAPGTTAELLRDAVQGRGATVVAVAHQPDCAEIVLALAHRRVAFPPGHVEELEL